MVLEHPSFQLYKSCNQNIWKESKMEKADDKFAPYSAQNIIYDFISGILRGKVVYIIINLVEI